MISKNLLVASLATLPLVVSLHAGSPLLKLTDDGSASIFFVADASAQFSDNIFYRADKTSDGIYTLAPGLNLVAGGEGNSKFNLVVKEALTAYWNNTQLNNQRTLVDATYKYDAGQAFKAELSAGYHQYVQPSNQTAVAGDIVKNDAYNAGVNAEYRVTEKSTVTVGGTYNGIRYTNYQGLFNDQDAFGIPVSWLYSVTDKLDLGFMYSYGYTDLYKNDTQSGAGFHDGNQQTHFGGLRARGSITEKLKLEANAGIGYSELKSVFVGAPTEDNTTFNFNLTSTYAVTEKLTASLSGGRNFSVGAQGQQITSTNGLLGLDYAISEQWSAGANTGYTNQQFAGAGAGTDRIFNAGANVTFKPNKYWNLSLAYTYLNDDTTRPGADDFDNNVVTLSASFRY